MTLAVPINEIFKTRVFSKLENPHIEKLCEHYIFCRILGCGESETVIVKFDRLARACIYDFMNGVVLGLIETGALPESRGIEALKNLHELLQTGLEAFKQEVQ
jgi:hypothetical protein